MKEVDRLLEAAALVESVYDAQGKRHVKSRTHGRTQTPAEVALRLLILKHVRNWSYDTLEREVRANLVYHAFTRIGDEKVPDAKTLARLGQVIGPEVITELHERLMELARERGVVQGRKMRVDTTVVETNIHYPTDSSLLGDGARVLTTFLFTLRIRLRIRFFSPSRGFPTTGFRGRPTPATIQALSTIPSEDSSAGKQRLGHISKQGNSLLRFLLVVEAAQAAARFHPDWRRRYIHLAMRRHKSIAKVAMGRKLGIRLYWMWRNGCEYSPSLEFGSYAGQLGIGHGVK